MAYLLIRRQARGKLRLFCHIRQRVIVVCVTLVLGFNALITYAEPTLPKKDLSLFEAILLSLRYNPSVRNAEIQRIIDKFNLRLAENGLEVQYALTGSATYTNSRESGITSNSSSATISPQATLVTPIGTSLSLTMNNPVSGSTGNSTTYNPSMAFSITQPLMQGAGSDVASASVALYNARIQEEINKLTLKSAIIQTLTQVIQQYMALVQAENHLELQQLSLARARATVKQYQALIKSGRNAPTDIVQPQADVATQELNLQQNKNDLQQAQQSLLYILGLDANYPITVPKQASFLDNSVPSLQESIAIALKHHINYQMHLLNYKLSEKSLVVAEDNLRTKLDLTASSTVGAGAGGGVNSGLSSLVNGKNYNNTVGLQLTVPIDNYTLKSAVVNARVALQQAKISLQALERQVKADVTSTYNSLMNQKQQIVEARQAVKLANNSLEIAKIKLKTGRITAFEVTSLQNALLTAQIAELNSEISYLTTLASFDQLLGTTLERWKIEIRY